VYTQCDEAPALATYSLLPIIRKFAEKAGIDVVKSDISVAGRIISHFPECLTEAQRIPDNLSQLGDLAKTPAANIVKLPNISASIPQLNEAIAELQAKGYNLPAYPQNPTTEEEKAINATYSKVLGSAVNPVLREGNSDRRVARPVKEYASKNPHKMGAWSPDCKSRVAHMSGGDFFESEQSAVMGSATSISIQHVAEDGTVSVLKENSPLQAGEVIDAAFLSVESLRNFIAAEIEDSRASDLMMSFHLKATMMKISDPIIFGHIVKVYYKDVFEKHAALFADLGVNPNNGFQDVYDKIKGHPSAASVEADISAVYAKNPGLAMVNSSKGITNLHVPNDVIIDASMPVVVRDSGMMWNKDDALEDVKCIIPDRCYAPMYQSVLQFCTENGQFDVATMGNVANVGLMAQKAQEYGSHPNTFEVAAAGTMQVVDASGKVVFEHKVGQGDIWRMCQTKEAPIKDWVRLAVSRARATGSPAIFWLDEARSHDAILIGKVHEYLKEHDTTGLEISIDKPASACHTTMVRAKDGKDTISVTGNVLRDYLTDLFPILELGTSAKMLSVVPLLAGGGLFETGAGGSAPKHVDQFLQEGHLRWDSLGEYLAMAVAFEHLGEQGNEKATMLGSTLNEAIGRLLDNRKSPSRKVNEIDNRGTNFYIALYWSQAMAAKDPDFAGLSQALQDSRSAIVQEHTGVQGSPVDVGGYYQFDDALAEKAMRPSPTLNAIIDGPL
jgi:isocitrate dehydrogenase